MSTREGEYGLEGFYVYNGAILEGAVNVDPIRGYMIRRGKIHMAQKLFAFHVEADSIPELTKAVQDGLAKLGSGSVAGGDKPAKGAAGGGAAAGGAKASLDQVKQALTALKTATDGGDPDVKAGPGIKAVKAVLRSFKVTNSADLKEEQYADVLKAIAEAMPAEDDDKF